MSVSITEGAVSLLEAKRSAILGINRSPFKDQHLCTMAQIEFRIKSEHAE